MEIKQLGLFHSKVWSQQPNSTRRKLPQYYDGGVNGFDEARAIVVDNAGNVYVTGYSTGNGTGADMVTIKYSPNGERLWPTNDSDPRGRYNGPMNGDDFGTAITKDDQGNVYVTGASEGMGTGWDYVTIKYKPNGDIDQGWNQGCPSIYNHNPAGTNFAGNRHDIPSAIALDGDGFVYVTGSSWRSVTSGSPPNEIVYQNYDYATVKYNNDGTLAKVKRYDGAGKGNDYASALAIDDTDNINNVYVTGSALWTPTYGYDFLTAAYKPNGDWLWGGVKRHAGSSFDFAKAIGVANGSVYVTGLSFNADSSANFTTIRYKASDGFKYWAKPFNKANLWDEPAGLVAKNDGVYVAGTTTDGDPLNNYTEGSARKYLADEVGTVSLRYNYPCPNYPCAGDAGFTALAVDGQGCLYVTGFSTDTRGGWNYKATTIKYSNQ
jgi:hypothetical protein